MDAFTKQQSRLVGIVDALDSCNTERILNVLNAVQTLLSSPNRPFVLLIAVDPHVIAKAAEANSRRLFTEGVSCFAVMQFKLIFLILNNKTFIRKY